METPSPHDPYASPGLTEPQGPPPLGTEQEKTDSEHLRLLSIFYYVFAGFTAVMSLVMIAYFVFMFLIFGTMLATTPMPAPPVAAAPAAVPPATTPPTATPPTATPPVVGPPAAAPPGGAVAPTGPPPAFFAAFTGMFLIMGCFVFFVNALFVAAYFYTGRSLKRCTNYVFCLVVAGFTCMQFPLGTALGVCTFIVLFRPGVKQMFNRYA